MKEEKIIPKGTQVTVKKYGVGTVEHVAQQESSYGFFAVYHVRFANDEVRHFNGEQVTVAK